MPDPLDWLNSVYHQRKAAGLDRSLRVRTTNSPLIDFASNDYLGLAADSRVIDAAIEATRRLGFGASASPLVSGWTDDHQALADDLARFEQVEAVALFPSGFAANLGAVAALVGPGDCVYADRLDHACLFAGARRSGATLRVYRHADAEHLDHHLSRDRQAGRWRRILVATESIFSMDGDLAPLPDLVDACERHNAILLVDEAHATGVLGPDGRGGAAELNVAHRVSVKVGTLSKALGSIGGFVAGSAALIAHLLNTAPTLIFSTALPPPACAAAQAALRMSIAEPWRRQRARSTAARIGNTLRQRGWNAPETVGPIVPLIVGDPAPTIELADRLARAGFHVPAIRPPTVPRGSSRLRISASAARSEEEVDRLLDAIGNPRLTPRMDSPDQAPS